ncbi:MAG: class I SAM-dependent methyltransferase [Gammaproteobacteria bacterium]|nr:class I SAM-dependent methyltransferase [Gammaproteobacteria bacterium]
MHNLITNQFYGVADVDKFSKGVSSAIDAVAGSPGIFAGDNLFTFGRNLSFLSDPEFVLAVAKNKPDAIETSISWRTHVLTWAARTAANLEGDFVEAGCYKGYSARVICDYLGFADLPKRYFLYDVFEHDDSMPHHAMPEHSRDLYSQVVARFADVPHAVITKGFLPASLSEASPEKICFMHIDMNNAAAEVGVLEALYPRVVKGGIIILDDYGWSCYRQQKQAEDQWFSRFGIKVLELPTGQGMVIKP